MERLLVDSAIWIDHLRRPEPTLVRALRARRALIHPFTIGELALGNLRDRAAVLRELALRLRPRVAGDGEVLQMIEEHGLYGVGIGWVDAHLLASTLLTPETQLWTRDKRLLAAAERLGVAAKPVN